MKGFLFGVLLTAACFLAWPRVESLVVRKGAVRMNGPVYSSVQGWMTERLADKNAEIVEIGEPMLLRGHQWRSVRLRVTTPMGGPVFVDYEAEFDGARLVKMWLLEELARFDPENPEANKLGGEVLDARVKFNEARERR